MSKKSTRVLVSGLVLGGAFMLLLVTSMRGSAQYFKEVDEVMPVAAEWYNRPLQLHGFVVQNSIMRRPDTLDYQFKVKNGESVVLASYTGVVPDTFKDGAEVVLKGRLHSAGFNVEPGGVVAKCPSKYTPADGAKTNLSTYQPPTAAPLEAVTEGMAR
ncbi:MAG: cytochrome c maturation protein CcmE [Vicinamibacterales bacterium]